jgi:hypothetical protein
MRHPPRIAFLRDAHGTWPGDVGSPAHSPTLLYPTLPFSLPYSTLHCRSPYPTLPYTAAPYTLPYSNPTLPFSLPYSNPTLPFSLPVRQPWRACCGGVGHVGASSLPRVLSYSSGAGRRERGKRRGRKDKSGG